MKQPKFTNRETRQKQTKPKLAGGRKQLIPNKIKERIEG